MKNINAGNARDITTTEPSTLPVSTNSGEQETQPLALRTSSEILSEAASDTMNYADNCMNELLSQMEQVRNCPESREPEKMASLAMGARSLAEVMREKISAMKLMKNAE